jgi:hypothetical protein
LSPFSATVDFGKLARHVTDDSAVPRRGPINRILASRFESKQGTDFTKPCFSAVACQGELRGRLQPYSVYVPPPPPRGRYGLTLLLHSLSANYNQFTGTRNQVQFAGSRRPSIVVTPEGRGPDGWYVDRAGADTFEAWADAARHYRLDPAAARIAGYSMGGYGTYKLAAQYPDLFARAQPTVGPPLFPGGASADTGPLLPSLRNVPILIWDAEKDELVPIASVRAQVARLDALGYRYALDVFDPLASPLPVSTPNHLLLAVNDQYAPPAAFLDGTRVRRNPAHVTYAYSPRLDFPAAGTTAGHAYWVSRIRLRDARGAAPIGLVDARSHGFGVGDPPVLARQTGRGTLEQGALGALAFSSQSRAWGAVPRARRANVLSIVARNVRSLTIDPHRAHVSCRTRLRIRSDGPLRVRLAGCRHRSR